MIRTLAIDVSTRNLGWACDAVVGGGANYENIKLPGREDRGYLYVVVREALTAIIETLSPQKIVYCAAFYDKIQTSARALQGVQAIAELVAKERDIPIVSLVESRARVAVLGKGDFAEFAANGKRVKGTGTKNAKRAVMAWCKDRQFWDGDAKWFTDDVGDALVLLHYERMRQAGYQDQPPKQKPAKKRAKPPTAKK